ncbi:MAG: hypothetical protein C0597_09985 [Marinilabiliales bacterium]|nr:MAG: hypothetical protein C0597_09985 [Marinilabiliales bacterium]
MKNMYLIIVLVLIAQFSFGQSQHQTVINQNMRTVLSTEIIQTTNYTYVQAREKDSLIWMAVPKMDAVKGKIYYFTGGMEMGPFKSKELDRTFDQLLFLGSLSATPDPNFKGEVSHTADVQIEKEKVKIESTEGIITIQELFANKDKYANQEVTVKGKVTKFSDMIMHRNWIHIQDGTNHEGEFDLTITSDEYVKVGDVVSIKGKLTLDKDFGYGYFYKLIIEEGKLVK